LARGTVWRRIELFWLGLRGFGRRRGGPPRLVTVVPTRVVVLTVSIRLVTDGLSALGGRSVISVTRVLGLVVRRRIVGFVVWERHVVGSVSGSPSANSVLAHDG